MSFKLSRRRVLRGLMNGAAVTVGLPFLECFLNDNGTAMASGSPLPCRFGTWFWGLGMTAPLFVPKKLGADYDLPSHIAVLRDVKQHINIFSNFNVPLEGRPNLCHYTGWVGIRAGRAPSNRLDLPAASLDVLVSDEIGQGTRFRSVDLAATGNARTSFSFRSSDAINPPLVSPVELYQTIFGAEFHDPNSSDFTPDPRIMVRKSVLSSVMEQSAGFSRSLGAADKSRLDEYFTSLRALEGRLALQLEKPEPSPACLVPKGAPQELPVGLDIELLQTRHNLMADILVMALACNQTKVFNMAYSDSVALTTRKGVSRPHHSTTHEEPNDPALGYQPESAWFLSQSMEAWAYFVKALASFKEGDGTLLDHSLIFAHTDQALAQSHTLLGIPMMTAGSASGRIKTGVHIDGNSSAATRVGLTAMQAMGLQVNEWGMGAMKTAQPISELIV